MLRHILPVVLSCGLAAAQSQPPTARQVIERIKANVGVAWQQQTVDTFKDGDPETPVTGIATTMMATYDVLQRASAAGANLIITHEPVFYNHTDPVAPLEQENDAVLAAKRAFIREHHLVIWRFHDHWHMRQPDAIAAGLARMLGWQKLRDPRDQFVYTLPETTLEALATDVKKRLHAATLRVVGNPAMKLTRAALVPGAAGFTPQRHALQRDDVDVVLIGEAQEWEGIEYAADASAQGRRKALIVIGHIASEQDGMDVELVSWLKGLVPEVKVTFVAARELFWAPK